MIPMATNPPLDCTRCGQAHQRNGKATCAGHVDEEDGTLRPCQNFPSPGQRVCWKHGGKSPQAKAAAARRIAVEQARRQMATYGVPTEGENWTDVLPEELRWSVAHVRWLREQIQAQEPDALVWGVADELDKGSGEFPGVDLRKAAAPSIWLELYHRERRYLLDVVKAMGATDAINRQIQLAESQGAAMYGVFARVLEALGLDAEQRALVPVLLAREVGALTGRVIEGRAQ